MVRSHILSSDEDISLSGKLAILYLISDLLWNSSSVPKASAFRYLFQECLIEIFEHLHEAFKAITGRLSANHARERVLKVVHAWRKWSLYTPEFLDQLESFFVSRVSTEDTSNQIATQNTNPDDEEPNGDFSDGEPVDIDSESIDVDGEPIDDIDGEPIDDVDGEPIDDIDGEPIDDIDGEPIDDIDGEPIDIDGEPIDDIDGEPIEDIDGEPIDDIDGEPMDDIDGEPMDDIDGEPMDEINEEPMEIAQIEGKNENMNESSMDDTNEGIDSTQSNQPNDDDSDGVPFSPESSEEDLFAE